jgi:hypothetical protein
LGGQRGVFGEGGHPIFPLSRKKLFKEKSIGRKASFFA